MKNKQKLGHINKYCLILLYCHDFNNLSFTSIIILIASFKLEFLICTELIFIVWVEIRLHEMVMTQNNIFISLWFWRTLQNDFWQGKFITKQHLEHLPCESKETYFFPPWPFILFLFIDIKKREKIINEKLKYWLTQCGLL